LDLVVVRVIDDYSLTNLHQS